MNLQIKEQIEKYSNILIYRHKNPDYDAICSQYSLGLSIEKTFPSKTVNYVHEDDLGSFPNLKLKSSFSYSEIEKSLVIIVDTANVSRIAGKHWQQGAKVIKIDHHPNVEPFGEINLVDTSCGANCQLVYELIKDSNFTLDTEIAGLLYRGIFADTGGFTYPNTSAQTLAIIASLRKLDNDWEKINLELSERSAKFMRLLGYIFTNITIQKRVGTFKITTEMQKEFDVSPVEASQMANYLGVIQEIDAWIIFNEHPTFIRLNMRSKYDIDVSKVAKNYGGGGHKNSSGGKIQNWNKQEQPIQDLILEVAKFNKVL